MKHGFSLCFSKILDCFVSVLLVMTKGRVLIWPNWLKFSFIMSVNLSLFLVIYMLILWPTQQLKQKNNIQITHLTSEMQQSKLHGLQKILSFKSVPLANWTAEINTLADKNDLNLIAMKPSPPANQQGFTIQSLQIRATGNYESIRHFLSELSQWSASITVGDCILQNSNTPPLLELIVNLNCYTKKL